MCSKMGKINPKTVIIVQFLDYVVFRIHYLHKKLHPKNLFIELEPESLPSYGARFPLAVGIPPHYPKYWLAPNPCLPTALAQKCWFCDFMQILAALSKLSPYHKSTLFGEPCRELCGSFRRAAPFVAHFMVLCNKIILNQGVMCQKIKRYQILSSDIQILIMRQFKGVN